MGLILTQSHLAVANPLRVRYIPVQPVNQLFDGRVIGRMSG
jgi:hypothetical protein